MGGIIKDKFILALFDVPPYDDVTDRLVFVGHSCWVSSVDREDGERKLVSLFWPVEPFLYLSKVKNLPMEAPHMEKTTATVIFTHDDSDVVLAKLNNYVKFGSHMTPPAPERRLRQKKTFDDYLTDKEPPSPPLPSNAAPTKRRPLGESQVVNSQDESYLNQLHSKVQRRKSAHHILQQLQGEEAEENIDEQSHQEDESMSEQHISGSEYDDDMDNAIGDFENAQGKEKESYTKLKRKVEALKKRNQNLLKKAKLCQQNQNCGPGPSNFSKKGQPKSCNVHTLKDDRLPDNLRISIDICKDDGDKYDLGFGISVDKWRLNKILGFRQSNKFVNGLLDILVPLQQQAQLSLTGKRCNANEDTEIAEKERLDSNLREAIIATTQKRYDVSEVDVRTRIRNKLGNAPRRKFSAAN